MKKKILPLLIAGILIMPRITGALGNDSTVGIGSVQSGVSSEQSWADFVNPPSLLFQAIPWVSYDSSTDISKVDILGSSKLNTLGPFLLQLEIPHSKFSQSQEAAGSRMLTE